jgi:peptidoglycan-associated lipoprotein
MKQSNVQRIHRTGLVLLSVAVGPMSGLLACAHARPAEATAVASAPAPVVQPAPSPEPAVRPVAAPAPVVVKTDSVYFDFDKSDLKPAGQEVLSGFGDLLAKHAELHVRIEGNCDERGTAQYNVALGYRRADSAKKYLLQMGASENQITTISFGKERPRAKGHDEESWRQNRRDDFVPDRKVLSVKPLAENS